MTKKASRAQNIRKLTPLDRQQLACDEGWGSDPHDRDRAQRLAVVVAKYMPIEVRTDFTSYLVGRIREYHAHERGIRGSVPTGRELKISEETLAVVAELRERLRYLPDRVFATAELRLYFSRGEYIDDELEALDRRLEVVANALSKAIEIVRLESDGAGAKPKIGRDLLVRDVLEEVCRRLPPKARRQSARVTRDLLEACDVGVREDPEELRKIATKVEKIQPY